MLLLMAVGKKRRVLVLNPVEKQKKIVITEHNWKLAERTVTTQPNGKHTFYLRSTENYCNKICIFL
jgi:hypothetical protein